MSIFGRLRQQLCRMDGVSRFPAVYSPFVTDMAADRRRAFAALRHFGRLGARGLFLSMLLWTASSRLALAQRAADSNLGDLTLEQLSDITVSSATKRAEKLSDAPASIFVITGDDIKRSGATNLPEALRLAPNLEVSQVNANDYAVSARGFQNELTNKLLVLIDGRTVYSPILSACSDDYLEVIAGSGQGHVRENEAGRTPGQGAVNEPFQKGEGAP